MDYNLDLEIDYCFFFWLIKSEKRKPLEVDLNFLNICPNLTFVNYTFVLLSLPISHVPFHGWVEESAVGWKCSCSENPAIKAIKKCSYSSLYIIPVFLAFSIFFIAGIECFMLSSLLFTSNLFFCVHFLSTSHPVYFYWNFKIHLAFRNVVGGLAVVWYYSPHSTVLCTLHLHVYIRSGVIH